MATVYINRNDEAGNIQFSVALKDDPEFWLDSFPTLPDAEAFIAENWHIYDPADYVDTVHPYRDEL